MTTNLRIHTVLLDKATVEAVVVFRGKLIYILILLIYRLKY